MTRWAIVYMIVLVEVLAFGVLWVMADSGNPVAASIWQTLIGMLPT